MNLFRDEIIEEFSDWKKANPNSFSWWSYINMKTDIQTALGLAKLFYPEIIEIDGCFLLKDNYTPQRFIKWKKVCSNIKIDIEKAMNSYELDDFFHINANNDNENIDEQIQALGVVLKKFWTLSFSERYPKRNIVVDIIEEDELLYITVFENA